MQKAQSFELDKKNQIIVYFLKCITEELLKIDNSETEQKLNEALKEKINISWGFNIMEKWLKSSDIKKENKNYILDKIKLVKENTIPMDL